MKEFDSEIDRLLGVMEKLRGPEGCPWDREQTSETLKSDLVEETYEVIDAIESGDKSTLQEELGDLLLQVVFHSRICEEIGAFSFSDVAKTISDKLIRRHPHVFGETIVKDVGEVLQNWDAIKRQEKGDEQPRSILAGIPKHLPALQKAYQVQKRAARAGFDWEKLDDVFDKLHEEIGELKEAISRKDDADIRDELGDLLFSVVNVSRFMGYNPEEILNHNIKKFIRRFKQVEVHVDASKKPFSEYSLVELDAMWDAVKAEEVK